MDQDGTHGVRVSPSSEDSTVLELARGTVFGQETQPTVVDTDKPDQYNADVLDHLVASWLTYDSQDVPVGYTWYPDDMRMGRLVRPDGHVIFAFRGTKDWKDIDTDINLMLGRDDGRFRSALEYVDSHLNGRDSKRFSVAGHSLGGALATYVASKRGLRGHVFNQAPTYERIPHRTKVQAHATVMDPVSMLSNFTNYSRVHYYKSPKGNPILDLIPSAVLAGRIAALGNRAKQAHSIRSFVPSKRQAVAILNGKNIVRFPRLPDFFN